MQLTAKEKKLIIAGYIQGYESGHNDTVESQYTDAEESGRDWLLEAIEDGGLGYAFEHVNEI